MIKWIKWFSDNLPVYGDEDTSWTNTRHENMIAVTVGGHLISLGPGHYHYEEDWEVTVGQNDHVLLCQRVLFNNKKAAEVYPDGAILRFT